MMTNLYHAKNHKMDAAITAMAARQRKRDIADRQARARYRAAAVATCDRLDINGVARKMIISLVSAIRRQI